MSEMYREQVISMEDEIASYKEKDHLKSDMYNVSYMCFQVQNLMMKIGINSMISIKHVVHKN